MDFNFGGRQTFSKAKNPGQSGILVGETMLMVGEIMAQVGVLNSPTVYVTEVLDAYLFDDLEEVCLIIERWLEDYNTIRPHEALQGLPPRQYAIQNA